MLTVLSPAKKLDFSNRGNPISGTVPFLFSSTKVLANILKKFSVQELSRLMGISPQLGKLNFERYQSFDTCSEPISACPAIYAFRGDTYSGLDADSLDTDDLTFAQEHLCILSGLYGLLRPYDHIQPYRLDMGIPLINPKGANLYVFWSDSITELLNTMLAEHKERVLINVASEEYFRAVNLEKIQSRIIHIVFKEKRNGTLKIIGLLAKRARGMMARYIIKERIDAPESLKDFTDGGYRFMPNDSYSCKWVFVR
ncbi:peroxide stress protein YaaA [bacterium]|nr:peroxide stress protein YaaA [bacterium]